jgi:hypothetical protein
MAARPTKEIEFATQRNYRKYGGEVRRRRGRHPLPGRRVDINGTTTDPSTSSRRCSNYRRRNDSPPWRRRIGVRLPILWDAGRGHVDQQEQRIDGSMKDARRNAYVRAHRVTRCERHHYCCCRGERISVASVQI